MDRKNHSFTWPYSCPPFSSAPGWFSVNGVGYQPPFTGDNGGGDGGGMENIGMGIPIWFPSPDLRSMPAMANPRQQSATPAQQANDTSSNNISNTSNGAGRSAPRNSSPAPGNAISTAAFGAFVPSRPSSPMTVDVAMQCLSGQLHDAIQLCADCLKMHAEYVATVEFTTTETRNGVWKDLLDHKLKSSGFLQDGFNNLGRRLSYYMEQAYCASQNDPALKSVERETQREAKDRIRRLRLLRATCIEVVKLSEEVSVDVLDCKEMLGLMREMKKKLSGKASEGQVVNHEDVQKDGEDGGDTW